MDKHWNAEIIPASAASREKSRPKLTIQEQIDYMRDKKGILFTIVSESEALEFLENSNYYFKVKAFAKNYTQCSGKENEGKYYGLEFAYLQELSTLDMHLREIILQLSLDVEHFLKVRLLKDISENENEDGYSIVRDFLNNQPQVEHSITEKAKSSYCEDLVNKYSGIFPVWAFVEVLSFGDFINFCDLYYNRYPCREINIGTIRIVKFLRNAAAHNNCLIHHLSDTSSHNFTQNRDANYYVSNIREISNKVRNKKMGNRTIHDFIVLLRCFDTIVTSRRTKQRGFISLKRFFDEQLPRRKEYFTNNATILSSYEFVKKIVDKMAAPYI